MANPSGRGSVKLSRAAGSIKSKLKGVKILDWQELGQPGPEVIFGTVETGLTNFKSNVAQLTKLKELRDLHIIIRGIPKPDLAQVNFTVQVRG